MENQKITKMANVLKAMANEKRLEILYHIAEQEYSVGEIEKMVQLSQSALSQHLAVLRAKGLVEIRRKSQTIFYSLKDEKVTKILFLLSQLF